MTIENSEYQLTSDESVLLSMDNIALDAEVEPQTEPVAFDPAESAVAPAAAGEVIPERINILLQPFPGYLAGQDPRYGDEFVLIKAEIDKLAFNDYNAVMTLAGEILQNESKDLRVVGYYLLASTYLHGSRD